MPLIQPFIIQPDPHAIRQHPTLTRQVRELSEAYEDGSITVDDKRLQLVGSLLWEVLSLGKQLDLAKEQAGNSNILPIIIESDDGLVISLPWETLHHPEYGFLARQPGFTLTRRMPKGKKSLPEPECAPLRVLLFTSLPDDLSEHARLQIEDEQAAVLQTLAGAEQEGRVQLEMPDDGRFDSFKITLQNFKPHVVYFSGHGKFDYEHHNTKAWAIFQFEDEWGKTLEVEENDIRDCLMDSGVQAVVLSACESAKSHKDYADNGLAQCLHVAGIPHVIGMRESVYDPVGIEFAKVLLAGLSQAQPMDQALQQARLAIQAMPKRKRDDEHWCLPAQFSQELSHPLMDWSFEPEARGQVQSTRESVNGISLPPKFIGRRRELREWQNALRNGSKSECLIIGAGGMGKTALAGKLLDSLKRDGYEVFGLSVRPDEEYDWRRSLSELEQLLKDEFLIKQYQAALGEATTIETPDDLDEPPKVTVDERKRAEALLDGLLRQYDGQFVLLIDNLESMQDENNLQVNDPILADWIEVVRGFSERGLKLILTSRWQLPEWGEDSLCILGQPVFADYVAFIRELNLPMRFIGNTERVRAAFEQLGGNYRALTFFAAAAQGLTLGAEQEFLEKLGQAQEEIQVDMAIEQVYEQLDESQREVLNLMRVYLYPVDMEGIRRIASPEYEGVDGIVESLLAVSFLERYWHEGLEVFEYFLPILVNDWVNRNRNKKIDNNIKVNAALYLLTQIEKGRKQTLRDVFNTYEMLDLAELASERNWLVLKFIAGALEDFGDYHSLIHIWLPKVCQSSEYTILAEAFNKLGRMHDSIGNYHYSVDYYKKSLKIAEDMSQSDAIANILNSMSMTYLHLGDIDSATISAEKSLELRLDLSEPNSLAKSYNNLSVVAYQKGNYIDSNFYQKKSIEYCKKAGNFEGIIRGYLNLSQGDNETTNWDECISYVIEALRVQDEINDEPGKAHSYRLLAELYLDKGIPDKVIEFSKKSINLSDRFGNNIEKAEALINIGQAYKNLENDLNASLYYLNQAYYISREHGLTSTLSVAINNISGLLWRDGKYEEAISRMNEAIPLLRNSGDYAMLVTVLSNIGFLNFEIGKTSVALGFIDEAYSISKEINDTRSIEIIEGFYEEFEDNSEFESISSYNEKINEDYKKQSASQLKSLGCDCGSLLKNQHCYGKLTC